MEKKTNPIDFILVVIALLLGGTFLYDRWVQNAETFDPAALIEEVPAKPQIRIQPQPQMQPEPQMEPQPQVQPTPPPVKHTVVEVIATPNPEGMVGYTSEIGGTEVTIYEFLQPAPVIVLPTPQPTQPAWGLPSVFDQLTSPTPVCKPPLACAANP